MEDLGRFVTNFIKSIKNHKLYQKLSDTTREFIEKCHSHLVKAQEKLGPIVLTINEDRIMHNSKTLHSDPKRITSIPLFLYRNGIRSLTFLEGVSVEELETLITIIASREYSSTVGLVEDLWEIKFPHIIYHVVEKTKNLNEYQEDMKPVSGFNTNEVKVLPVKVKKKNPSENNPQKIGLAYKPKISIDRQHSSFLLIESIKDLLYYEKVYRKRKKIYSVLKESIPSFLASGRIPPLYQTKKLIENLKKSENKEEFKKTLNEINKDIVSKEAIQLYIHALTSSNSHKIKREAAELIEYTDITSVEGLINELEITNDFIVKDSIISLLKNIFSKHKEELKKRLVNSEDKTFSILLLIIKRLKDPYFIPCLKDLFEKEKSPKVKEVLFSLLSRKELLKYVDHHDSQVRVLALEKLNAIWTPEEFEKIRNKILSRNFWNLPKKERKALLELLSSISTDDTIKIFSAILNKWNFFNERVLETKRMALSALSNIKNEKAKNLIARYKNSRRLKETAMGILKDYETD